ncbi:cytochrome C biogenesis protein (plasmid) [Cnuibacter physcomitrellae]|uniref:Cytochrome C biogenesis protein n=1 Tax=Cnuibacter physcomitrellae TaxID=1619308 RepID=A0A1X9LR13_9MICO|nr:cytochrome C biogenesis protein [Cnuibacter physcomitrellae]
MTALSPDRPADHVDAPVQPPRASRGWVRWAWRQLTSMRTALFLLLLLALASVPGSLVPQRSSDPNGVTQYFDNNPQLAPILDAVQAFDSYGSWWYSSIYLLLFVSLIGCVIPRIGHHWKAFRANPPRTPSRLSRLPAHTSLTLDVAPSSILENTARSLRAQRYRVTSYDSGPIRSISAERGYLRETGNLVFHLSLVGVLLAVAAGGLYGYSGQRVVVEGEGFANTQGSYDSFTPGRLFTPALLDRYSLALDGLDVTYETGNRNALGQPLDFTARVTVTDAQAATTSTIRVNQPLEIGGTDVFLLGNGYAPQITVRNPAGDVVFSDAIAFLPQDANLTSLGVIKVPDGLTEQIGMLGFLYPTEATSTTGAKYSSFPDLIYPAMTLNVFQGDLGLDTGSPISAYSLDTDSLQQLTGGDSGTESLRLQPGETVTLPNGLGSITFDSVRRFASFDFSSDPAQDAVLLFALTATAGLLTSLFVPRRRIWVKVKPTETGTYVEYAALARGDDPRLDEALTRLRDSLTRAYPPAAQPTLDPEKQP